MASNCACCVDTDCTCAEDSCVCNDYSVEEKIAYIRQMLETGLEFTRDLDAGKPVESYAAVIHQAFKKAMNSFDEIEEAIGPEMLDVLLDIRQATQDLVYYLIPKLNDMRDPVLTEQVVTLHQLLQDAESDQPEG
jgi:hypothetical protein